MFKGTLYAYIILHIHAFSFICKETLQNKVMRWENCERKSIKMCKNIASTPEIHEVLHVDHIVV